ncbi:hypothetical protein EDC19_0775 [Natranaerovirga hydrolytica]|uniref:Divergent PAP2 family protein n=1 Tax=Natranaerovirga hydrolytica TaxID=680378 RepID=A0A4R1MYX2_9FIRM|nr:divergent PAP2 family protein [Natranaerovirga hydrolytica]TCK98355.1 hypothetical protein EDC19_0775 [Natranaerovirga hydrolytica]
MKGLIGIFDNKVLISALLSWFIAQLLKLIITLIKEKELDFTKMIASGGMPSAHTATVTALAVSVGELNGYESPLFGISLVFALIVMYDASGVRRAAGKQAQVLNKLVEQLGNKDFKIEGRLKELIGHTPIEVFGGAILGIVVTLLYLY